MNWIDLACIIIISLTTLVGLVRGFLRSVFRIVAWVVGLAGAFFSQSLLSDFVEANFDVPTIAVKPICLICGFVIPFAISQLVGHFLHTAVSHSFVSRPNRVIGGLFGALKGTIICFILLTIVHFLPLKSGSFFEMRESAFASNTYKVSLEALGYSSKPKDILKKAEKTATKLETEITEKASQKIKETADVAAEVVVDHAKDAALKAANSAVKKATDAMGKKSTAEKE